MNRFFSQLGSDELSGHFYGSKVSSPALSALLIKTLRDLTTEFYPSVKMTPLLPLQEFGLALVRGLFSYIEVGAFSEPQALDLWDLYLSAYDEAMQDLSPELENPDQTGRSTLATALFAAALNGMSLLGVFSLTEQKVQIESFKVFMSIFSKKQPDWPGSSLSPVGKKAMLSLSQDAIGAALNAITEQRFTRLDAD